MAQERLATFKIDSDRWESFKAKAQGDNTNASELLKRFIDAYLQGSIDAGIDGSLDRIDSNLDQRIDRAIAPLVEQIRELGHRLGESRDAA